MCTACSFTELYFWFLLKLWTTNIQKTAWQPLRQEVTFPKWQLDSKYIVLQSLKVDFYVKRKHIYEKLLHF